MSESASDADLLAHWRGGNTTAGDTLLVRHVGSVYRFFANKAGDKVEDLAQETFAGCLRNAHRYDPQRSFRAYLLGTARHVLMHHYRSLRRETAAVRKLEAGGSAESYIGSATAHLARGAERRLLLAALRRLSIAHQICLELYYWEGLATAEIAEVVGVSPGTARSRVTRARAALRTEIEQGQVSAELRTSTITNLDAWAESLRDVLGAASEPSM